MLISLYLQTADEAVSDLSSLSGDDTENQKAFEDNLAQAVVAKVIQIKCLVSLSNILNAEYLI